MNAYYHPTWALLGLTSLAVASEPRLTLGNAPGYPGAPTSVPLLLRDATNVVALQLDVTFNPDTVGATPDAMTQSIGGRVVKSREIAPGVLRVLVYSRNNQAFTNISLGRLPFTVQPGVYTNSGPIIPHNIIALAKDTSEVKPVTLESGTIFSAPVNVNPDGSASFFLASQPGLRYVLEYSPDLFQWTPFATNVASSEFLETLDIEAPGSETRFYRSQIEH